MYQIFKYIFLLLVLIMYFLTVRWLLVEVPVFIKMIFSNLFW